MSFDNEICNVFPYANRQGNNDADTLINGGDHATVDGGAGNDVILNVELGSDALIKGGNGNDTIFNSGLNATIEGGEGDDLITLNGGSARILFQDGDGNDTVLGVTDRTTLDFNYDSIMPLDDGAVIKIGSGSIALSDLNEIYRFGKFIVGSIVNDKITNAASAKLINGAKGNDSIVNNGDNVTMRGSGGNDTLVNNDGYYVSMDGGDGDDYISTGRFEKYETINGGKGNDFITAHSAVIEYADGDGHDTITKFSGNFAPDFKYDSIVKLGNDVLMTIGDGSILIKDISITKFIPSRVIHQSPLAVDNTVAGLYIESFERDEVINNYGDNVTIDAGAGNDVIRNNGAKNVSIIGGKGNDKIELDLYGKGGTANIYYEDGDGHDTIIGFNDNATINRFNFNAIEQKDGDVIMTIGSGSLRFVDTLIDRFVHAIRGTDGNDTLTNDEPFMLIYAEGGNDLITNTAVNVQIYGEAGNDSIINSGAFVSINGGYNNDTIENTADNVSIEAWSGNDVIENSGDNVTINGSSEKSTINNSGVGAVISGGSHDDYVINGGDNVSIDSGLSEDTVVNSGADATIVVGNGYGVISLAGGSAVLQNTGRGHAYDYGDSIFGFNENSTLAFKFDSVYPSGSDVIMWSNNKKLTFKDAPIELFIPVMRGTDDGDVINNDSASAYILGGKGDDTITNSGAKSIVDGGADNDSIVNIKAANVSINGGAGDDALRNVSSNNVTLMGGAGRDTLVNESGSDVTVDGGSDSDVISIGSGNIVLEHSSGDGDDTVYGLNNKSRLGFSYDAISLSGGDVIVAHGDNILTFKAAPLNRFLETWSGTAGHDTISNNVQYAYHDNKYIDAGPGDDTIINTGEKVVINAGAGNDVIRLKGGNEIIQYAVGDGNDTVYGFTTKTQLIAEYTALEQSGNDVIAKIGNGSITFKNTPIGVIEHVDNSTVQNDKDGEYISLGSGNDTVVNSGDNVTINAGRGNDLISLVGGNEIIQYASGDGNDTVIGFKPETQFIAEYTALEQAGNDVIARVGNCSVTFKDTEVNVVEHVDSNIFNNRKDGEYISLGSGNDTVVNSGDNVTINGGRGADVISLVGGSARIFFQAGNGNDTVIGFDGNSTLGFNYDSIGKSGADVIVKVGDNALTFKDTSFAHFLGGTVGTDGDDSISNSARSVYIDGGKGNDTVNNSGSGVTIEGGRGEDVINLNDGSARIFFQAGDGNDTVIGFDGNSTLGFNYDSIGKSGADVIVKVGGNALTFKDTSLAHFLGGTVGTDGDDSISNSARAVYIDGGKGNDYVYNDGGSVTVDGGNGNDTIIASADYSSVNGGDGDDSIYSSGSNERVTITGGKGNDTIFLADLSGAVINGGSAVLQYVDGNDTVIGLSNRTTLDFNYDSLEQSGNDVIVTIGGGSITFKDASLAPFLGGMLGDKRNDRFNNSTASKYIDGADGNDSINNSGADATIFGGAGNDTINNNKNGKSAWLLGGNGDDSIVSRAQNCLLNGGNGNDTLIIADNSDGSTLKGGKGNDSIRLNKLASVVQYAVGDGNDTVYAFSDKTTLDFNYDSVQQSGSDVIMKIGEGSITFKDTAIDLFNVESTNDQLSAILEPAAPLELGDPDFDVSEAVLSIDKNFGGVTSISRHKNTRCVIKRKEML